MPIQRTLDPSRRFVRLDYGEEPPTPQETLEAIAGVLSDPSLAPDTGILINAGRVTEAPSADRVRRMVEAFRDRAGLLRDRRFAVVYGGGTAIEALKKRAFDAVISDIRMPGLDGLGVLRAVRDHDADLPVVLTTGDPSLEGVSQALDYGALHYLIKPVPLEKLVDTATVKVVAA